MRESTIEVWDDTQIKPGAIWAAEIQSALEKAKVAVLLISADFMASDFIASNELPSLLHAAKEDGATIIPVIVSASIFPRMERLARFQAVNDPSRPLVDMTQGEQEAIFAKIAEQVDLTIGRQELRAKLESVKERLDWTEEAVRKIVAYTPGHFAHQALCQIRDKADEYYKDTNWHKKRILLLLLDNGYLQPPPGANEVVFSDEQEKSNKRLFEIAALTPMAELLLRLREEINRAPTGG